MLLLAIAAGGALRIRLALTDDGIYWPDEIFQSLEPAHRLVFGYGMVAWEFLEGARNWALPGVVAAVLWVLSGVGLDAPAQYIPGLKTFFALIGTATVYAVWRLARSLGARELHAALGALAFALLAPAIYFAPRGMSETVSTLPLVLGLAWALPATAERRSLIGGASLLGVATLLRLQNGVFCVGLIAVLLARRAWRQAAVSFGVLLGWAFLFGLLDRLTWGHWFHSASVYLRFNLVEGKASLWGTAAPGYYLQHLFTSMPAAFVVLVALSLLAWSRARGLLLIAASFLLLHSLVPHKELRFVFAALPLLCALAALGVDTLWAQKVRQAAIAALVVSTGFSALRHRALTFGDLGQYLSQKPRASAYDDFGGVNRLLMAAHERPDLCGLKVEAVHLAWSGGQSHLHREVPLYAHNGPRAESRHYNYVVTQASWARSGGVVAADGTFVLVRLPWPCTPDGSYSWRLP